jgi:hypothetical protein
VFQPLAGCACGWALPQAAEARDKCAAAEAAAAAAEQRKQEVEAAVEALQAQLQAATAQVGPFFVVTVSLQILRHAQAAAADKKSGCM